MNLRIDLEVVTVERLGGDLLYIEGRTSDGNQAAFNLRAAVFDGAAPQVGQRLALTLTAAQAAAPSLRERMQASRVQMAPSQSAAPQTAAPPLTAARASSAAPRQDTTGGLLAGILGNNISPMRAAVGERDVDDELNALLGPPRRKG
jgi:hypothetical protein